MNIEKTIPVLRIFDYDKSVEFYVGWLGFEIVWEHHFEEHTPVYMEISKDDLTLHLSEHHGDGTPGSRVFVWCTGLKSYHQQLTDKKYKYNRPGLEETFYGAFCMNVIDPFGNIILFNEKKAENNPAVQGSDTAEDQ
jgi:catechol 2,3-dioxygenase-like lactoylglutathione lyase family enzyme